MVKEKEQNRVEKESFKLALPNTESGELIRGRGGSEFDRRVKELFTSRFMKVY